MAENETGAWHAQLDSGVTRRPANLHTQAALDLNVGPSNEDPCKMLLLEIVRKAFFDLSCPDERDEAIDWLSDNEADEDKDPFTFKWICFQLDLNFTKLSEIANRAYDLIASGRVNSVRVSHRILKIPKGAKYEYFQNI